ncbi:MAG: hypothetical protein ACP5L5_10960 [Vulcanisaeta sp.]|uniref:hypothetical protein n=1 Tax=Vulcanisaeta sp. TaxID=2020871 RepID=UPI003D0C5313
MKIHRWLLITALIVAMSILVSTNYILASASPNLGGYVCELGSKVAEGIYWTPIILLNSPYAGYASAMQGLTYTATYTFSSGPVTLTSQASSSLSITINANNGAAVGLFRLDEWAIYNTKMVPVVAGYEPCTQPYVAQDLGPVLVENAPYLKIIPILPPGTTSDENEPNQVYSTVTFPNGTTEGFYSINFNNGFSSVISTLNTCNAVQSTTMTVSQTSTTLLTASVSISINGYSSGGSVTIQTTTTNAWSYTFPPGYIYYISYAGGQGPAYAFKTQTCSG